MSRDAEIKKRMRVGGTLIGKAHLHDIDLEVDEETWAKLADFAMAEDFSGADEILRELLIEKFVHDFMNLADFEFEGDSWDLPGSNS